MDIVGPRSLRARLSTTDHLLDAWMSGRARVPDRVFDIAVSLILDDDIARAAQDRRELPRDTPRPFRTAA